MKAKFKIKADCIVHEADEVMTGEEVSSFIKGILKAAGIDAKVLIGFLTYDGENETEVIKIERLRKGRSSHSK